MVNKISPVSCINDFYGKNKNFKKHIENESKNIGDFKSFKEILQEAKNKLNGECN